MATQQSTPSTAGTPRPPGDRVATFGRLIGELEDLDYRLGPLCDASGHLGTIAVYSSDHNPLRALLDHTTEPARARLVHPASRGTFTGWEIAFTIATPTPAQLVTLYAALNPDDNATRSTGDTDPLTVAGEHRLGEAPGSAAGPGEDAGGAADPHLLWGHLIRTLQAAGFTGQPLSVPDGLVGPIHAYTAAHHRLRVVLDGAIEPARARLGVPPGVSTFGWQITITATTPIPAQQVTLHAALHAEDPVAAVHAAYTVARALGAAEAAGGTLGVAAPSR